MDVKLSHCEFLAQKLTVPLSLIALYEPLQAHVVFLISQYYFLKLLVFNTTSKFANLTFLSLVICLPFLL